MSSDDRLIQVRKRCGSVCNEFTTSTAWEAFGPGSYIFLAEDLRGTMRLVPRRTIRIGISTFRGGDRLSEASGPFLPAGNYPAASCGSTQNPRFVVWSLYEVRRLHRILPEEPFGEVTVSGSLVGYFDRLALS